MARATQSVRENETVVAEQPAQKYRPLKKVAFWIPTIADEIAVQRKRNRPLDWWDVYKWGWEIVNPNGSHRTYVLDHEIQFVGGIYNTSDPHAVDVLLTDPIARCRRADIVVAGVYSLPQMQAKGYLKNENEIAECLRLCAEAGVDPNTQSPDARRMASVELYALPDFAKMSAERILEWASNDTPSAKRSRGTGAISLSVTASKDEMVRNIRAVLVERGDPRQW
jgi:hypothetical protein